MAFQIKESFILPSYAKIVRKIHSQVSSCCTATIIELLYSWICTLINSTKFPTLLFGEVQILGSDRSGQFWKSSDWFGQVQIGSDMFRHKFSIAVLSMGDLVVLGVTHTCTHSKTESCFLVKSQLLCGTGSIIYKSRVQKTNIFLELFSEFQVYHTVQDGTEKETFNMHHSFVFCKHTVLFIEVHN